MHRDQVERQTELLDWVKDMLECKTQRELADRLEKSCPEISKFYNGVLAIGDTTIISISEETGISVREIKEWLGQRTLPVIRPEKPDRRKKAEKVVGGV